MNYKLLTKMGCFFIAISSLLSCAKAQNSDSKLVSAAAFSDKIKQQSEAIILDVRTPEEFEKGHLPNAININKNAASFVLEIAALDKEKTYFVYCLSGARSSAAAQILSEQNFKNVYQLQGGILQWRAANLPETSAKIAENTEMSLSEYSGVIKTNTMVLVVFYAEWCAPCKKMKPYLAEIATEQKDSLHVIRINADANPQLCKELKIDGVPFLKLYKNKQEAWSHQGFLTKNEIEQHL